MKQTIKNASIPQFITRFTMNSFIFNNNDIRILSFGI